MKKLLVFLFFLALLPAVSRAQDQITNSYHSPLGIPLVLASNFGELRPNHFHMGLDFKTNMKTGYRLYSIEDGYVSRIKVSPYGYGKVVYIDHPDGITSVYAHCSEFKGEIDSIVKATQAAEQNYAVEIFPGKGVIKVSKGEVIALSGNTGGSTAPHLHFELRDTKTEHALNPLLYGFDIADSKAPQIRTLKVYSLTKEGYRRPDKATSKRVVKGKYGFYIGNDEITIPANYLTKTGGLGIAMDVIDRFDGANNQCGLYGSYLIVNGDTVFGQKTDRIPFESTRYVNSHKDYEAYQLLSKKYHKCFRTQENDLPIYINQAIGLIKAKPGDVLKVKYIGFDASGNESVLEFTLKIASGTIDPNDGLKLAEPYLHPQHTYAFESEQCQLEFGMASVYEPINLTESELENSIAKGATPVNRAYQIKLKHTGHEDGKHYIEIISNKGRKKAISVQYDDGWVIAESKYFGKYKLKRDTLAPKIIPVNISTKQSQSSIQTFQWRISDVQSGIADYDVFIEGEWHLLSYDYKTGLVKFTRPAGMVGRKQIRVRVVDECGNVSEWITEITLT